MPVNVTAKSSNWRAAAAALVVGALSASAAPAQDAAPAKVFIPDLPPGVGNCDPGPCQRKHKPETNDDERRPDDDGPGTTGDGDDPPPPHPDARLVWYVVRVGENRDVEWEGPLALTRSQYMAEKARRDADAKARYGPKARIVMGTTADNHPCAFLYKPRGSDRFSFSIQTSLEEANKTVRQYAGWGSVAVSGPACER